MEWQPIETAPSNVRVEGGGWDSFRGEREWKTGDFTPYRTKLFGLIRVKDKWHDEYTHWRPLPGPPDV